MLQNPARKENNSGYVAVAVMNLHEMLFCFLGSRSVWVRLPVPLCHKSLCQPVSQTLVIKISQLGCLFWMGWLNSLVLARTVIHELSWEDSSVMITVINVSLKGQWLCTKKETVREKPCTMVCEMSSLQQCTFPS